MAAALAREGPFDLVLTGRNSVDADTGQVGPEVAELLISRSSPACAISTIESAYGPPRCEHDDGWVQAEVAMPAVVSCAERLIDPARSIPPGGPRSPGR